MPSASHLVLKMAGERATGRFADRRKHVLHFWAKRCRDLEICLDTHVQLDRLESNGCTLK
jgi:hypothetical protein